MQLGSLVVDAVYALVAFTGLATLARGGAFHVLLGLTGTGILLALGYSTLRQGWRREAVRSRRREIGRQSCEVQGLAGSASHVVRRGALLGASISLASPFGVAFWLAVGGAILQQARADATPAVAGFAIGSLLWVIGFPVLLGITRGAIGLHADTAYRVASMVCGLALIGFGIALGQAAVRI
jgi:threonine/homoserine/homoserine lactone efflux protein